MSQRMPDYDAMRLREQQARTQERGQELMGGILARRAERCAKDGCHTGDGCPACGA